MNATVYGLIAFIIAQPADRVIASQDSWNECAVGDYARDVHNHEIAKPVGGAFSGSMGADYTPVHRDPVLKALVLDANSSKQYTIERYNCRELAEPSVMDLLSECPDDIETYGQLRAWLGDALHVSPA